jgi:hypothetical protein
MEPTTDKYLSCKREWGQEFQTVKVENMLCLQKTKPGAIKGLCTEHYQDKINTKDILVKRRRFSSPSNSNWKS